MISPAAHLNWAGSTEHTCYVCSETYQYYNLPFCTPEKGKEYKPEGLGEVLEGDRLVTTPYDIKFKVNKENELLCSQELTAKDLQKFRKAVKKDYYFQARFFEVLSHNLPSTSNNNCMVPCASGLQLLHQHRLACMLLLILDKQLTRLSSAISLTCRCSMMTCPSGDS